MVYQYTKQIQSALDDVISSMEEWDGKIIAEAYENHVLKSDVNVMEYVKTQYKELLSPVVSSFTIFHINDECIFYLTLECRFIFLWISIL